MKWLNESVEQMERHNLETPLGILAVIQRNTGATGYNVYTRQATQWYPLGPVNELGRAKQLAESVIRELCRDTLGDTGRIIDIVESSCPKCGKREPLVKTANHSICECGTQY